MHIDKRRHSFFIIDNEVLDDYQLSEPALVYYAWLCRHAKHSKAYSSKSEKARRYSTGTKKWLAAERELIDKQLVKKTGQTDQGATIYDILPVKKGVGLDNPGGGSVEPRGWVQTTQGVGSDNPQTRLINNTDKQDSANAYSRESNAIRWFNKTFDRNTEINKSNLKLMRTLLNILKSDEEFKKTCYNMAADKWAKSDPDAAIRLSRLLKPKLRSDNLDRFRPKKAKPAPKESTDGRHANLVEKFRK